MCTLDRDESVKLAEGFEIATDRVTSAADLPGHADVRKDVDRANRTFARIEQVKRFAVPATISARPTASSRRP